MNKKRRDAMVAKTTRMRVDRELAGKAMRALGAKSRTEAVRVAVEWIVGLKLAVNLPESAAMNRDRGTRKKAPAEM
jgi:Arc/MetJ family transcription regulator